MLNEVVIEGYIAGEPWKFRNDTLFRLACARDPQHLPKADPSGDGSDYITVRLPAPQFAGIPFTLDRTKIYRVHGFLQSREYHESLEVFLRRAHGLTSQVQVAEVLARQVTHNRVATEVVAERISQIERPAPGAASRRRNGSGEAGGEKETAPGAAM